MRTTLSTVQTLMSGRVGAVSRELIAARHQPRGDCPYRAHSGSVPGRSDSCVSDLTVFADIQSLFLFVFGYAQADGELDRVPEDKGGDQRVGADGSDSFELRDEQRHAATVEESIAGGRTSDLVR